MEGLLPALTPYARMKVAPQAESFIGHNLDEIDSIGRGPVTASREACTAHLDK